MKNFIFRTTCNLALYSGILISTFDWLSAKAIATKPIKEKEALISAQNSNVSGQTAKKPKFPKRGIPTGRRRGGTSRSECPLDKPLTAIVPGQETIKNEYSSHSSSPNLALQSTFSNSESFLARTLEEYPNFWLYVPKVSGSSNRGEFVLQDEKDRDLYRTSFKLPSESGILNVNLPRQAQNSLKIGQKYHWYVKVFCGDQGKRAKYIFVDAWLKRVAVTPKIEQQLSNKNVSEYQVYVDHNLWYDAIDRLAQLKKVNPHNNFENERWNQLLSNLGLSDLMDKNMLNIRANYPAE